MQQKLIHRLGDIHHVLMAGICVFCLEQLSQIPFEKLTNNFIQSLPYIIITLVGLAICLGWVYCMLKNNQQYETTYDFYHSLKHILWLILISFVLMQFWYYLNTQIFGLKIGSTTENQQALDAIGKTPLGLIMEWLLVTIPGPIVEEFLFRYAIMQPKALHTTKNRLIRLIIAITTFAVAHMLIQLFGIHSLKQFEVALYGLGQYLILSSIFSLNYYYRNSIIENMGMHVIYNATVMCFSVL